MINAEQRVVLIGPVLPFRGGIAQHTTLLHRALRKLARVKTISFTRQYPKWLFPGKSDRAPEYQGHHEEGVDYLVDSINPLTWHRAVNEIEAFNPECVVFPWWTYYWTFCFGYIASVLKRNNLDIVFLCHNVIEHDTVFWKTFLTKIILKQGSRFVVHTREDHDNLQKLLPDAVISIHPHPIYDQFPKPKHTLPRRARCELLFYGFVRPYKGLDDLIEAMALLKEEDLFLTIAGEFWKGAEKTALRVAELGLEERIEILDRYHSDMETAELFSRADVIVLPYRSATGSGVIPVAYQYNKPVIVTEVGGLPDIVLHGETGLIAQPHDPVDLSNKIRDFCRGTITIDRNNIVKFKKMFSWSGLAKTLITTC